MKKNILLCIFLFGGMWTLISFFTIISQGETNKLKIVIFLSILS